MSQRQSQVTDEYDRGVEGASVYVYDANGNQAALTSDGTAPLAQPVKTDDFGVYTYHAPDGLYREDIYYGGKLRYRETGIPIGLGSRFDVETAARIAADNALETAIDVEAAIRAADDDAEEAARQAADAAILVAIQNAGGALGTVTIEAASRTILAGLDTTLGLSAMLTEGKRVGHFVLENEADWTAEIAADTRQGVFVPSTFDPTKVWRRVDKILTPFAFGAAGDGVTDDLAAYQAWNDFVFAVPIPDYEANGSGHFGISGQLFLGPPVPAAMTQERKARVSGEAFFTQLTATFETVRFRNFQNMVWNGSISAKGIGGGAFADRTCGIGFTLQDVSGSVITGKLEAYNFWFKGILSLGESPLNYNNIALNVATVRAEECGSGAGGVRSLTANYSGAVDSGSSGNFNQRTTMTVDTLPPAEIENLISLIDQIVLVRFNGIGGQLRRITAIDRVAGTIEVYPWIDPSYGVAGTLEYVFGGGIAFYGGMTGVWEIGHLKAQNCGIGRANGALYGPVTTTSNISSCGINTAIGRGAGSATMGSKDHGYYGEMNYEEVVLTTRGHGNTHGHVIDAINLELNKCWSIAWPLVTGGTHNNTTFGVYDQGQALFRPAISIRHEGQLHEYHGRDLNTPLVNAKFFDHQKPPTIRTQFRDGQSVFLWIVDESFARLFGYSGARWCYIGTGADFRPTGTFTFNPPTKAFAGATTTNGSAVVTMASTAGLIAGMPITGTGIPASTTILSVDSATQITLSANATASGTVTVTVTGRLNGTFAAVAFSGWVRPAEFEIHHRDVAQLDWTVAVVGGL